MSTHHEHFVSPFEPKQRLLMIVGNYGSGKTEVSVNLALHLRRRGAAVSIADLDVVNPYFRCREAQVLMRQAGVRVVLPPGAQQQADLPIVVPEIKGMLEPEEGCYSLFDVGGDPVGATLLSSLHEALGATPYSLMQVINARRPFTNTVDGCLKMQEGLENASRLKVTGYIVNTHLIAETTAEVILDGFELTQKVSQRSGLPIEMVTAMGALADDPRIMALPAPLFRLERVMLPPWLQQEMKDDSKDAEPVPASRPKPLFAS
ncbi:MAG: cobalamin biosynthesis protein CbiA [Myxococcota bacterium]|jgi:hypothetical protein|nr:cobalamin biosynthesis protein CbiA [Myxococcota bacterium]